MDEKEFLQELSERLKGVPEEEKEDILADFREHISIGRKEGRSEEELVASLGDPALLAKQIRASYLVRKAEDTTSTGDVMRAVFAFVALGLFNIFFILGPFLSVVGLLVVLFALAGSVILTGVTVLGASILGYTHLFGGSLSLEGIHPAAGAFLSLGTVAFGLLFLIGDWLLLQAFYNLTLKYLKINVDLINPKGGKQ